eukprot:SAG25_NODE_32_length_20323_cov_59.467721_1_plen_77_part_00
MQRTAQGLSWTHASKCKVCATQCYDGDERQSAAHTGVTYAGASCSTRNGTHTQICMRERRIQRRCQHAATVAQISD